MNKLDVFNLPYTKEVFDSMRTSKISPGVFQLGASKTAHLAHGYKYISNDGHIIDLVALIRPSCSDVKLDDGQSIMEHYIKRLNGEEEVTYLHPKLEPILKDTYGFSLFQEQSIRMTSELAGFDLVKADLMRQAIGKKDFKKMYSMKEDFIKGCKEYSGISEDIAEQIFDQIKASGRYQFNRCISGRETIFRRGFNTSFVPTIAEMYHLTYDIEYAKRTGHLDLYKKYKLKKYGKCYSLSDDGRLYKNDIIDIRYIGIKPLYRVTLENGYTIDVTDNHKFPTIKGEKQLKSLKVGDKLFVCPSFDYVQDRWDGNLISERDGWQSNLPIQGQRGFQTKEISLHRNYQIFKNKHTGHPCYECGKYHKRMEIHHIDGDHSNSVEENLAWLCCSCHKIEHYKMGRRKQGEKGFDTLLVKIISIDYIGNEDVYDVEVSGDVSHTFVTAGGIVTSNSHSTSYGIMACIDLWFRHHHPHLFYATKISNTICNISDKEKRIQLLKDLVRSAKKRDITVLLPTLKRRNIHTEFSVKDNELYFGFAGIGGTRASGYRKLFEKMRKLEKTHGSILEQKWPSILYHFSPVIGKTAFEAFVSIGIFDYIDTNRKGLLYDYNDFLQITGKEEVAWLIEKNFPTFREGIKQLSESGIRSQGGGCSNKNRVGNIRSIYQLSLTNRPPGTDFEWIINQEESRMGVSFSNNLTVGVNLEIANTTLLDMDKPKKGCIIPVCIKNLKVIQDRNGDDMAFLSVIDQDNNESESFVMFSNVYQKYSDFLFPYATLMCFGEINDRGSFLINKIERIQGE